MISPIHVRHSGGGYEVRFCQMAELGTAIPGDVFWITDENVFGAWGAVFPDPKRLLVLPPGEHTKSIATLERAENWLSESGASRESRVVAIGGGVIGDLAGFAAATYMRGVPLIQAPTSLLAQVDSSVGGKVGVDLASGKNLCGAFYPPESVYVAFDALTTLPDRQFRNGMAEVWKYGFIMDAAFVSRLREEPLTPRSERLGEVISRCIDFKRQIVEEDEMDRSGRRAILNFGHTVGHALEHATGYGPLLHGEAISIGMVAEARVGEVMGITEAGTAQIVRDCLSSSGLPTEHGLLREPEALLPAMKRDKKSKDGAIAMSLAMRLGECKLVEDVPVKAIEAALRSI